MDMGQKVVSGIKRLSRLPKPLKQPYFKSGFDYFFPKLNLIKTLQRIVPTAGLDRISAAVDSTLCDEILLKIISSRPQANGMLSDCELNLIHALTLLIQPEVVLETGVASGGSSAAILSALCKNNKGKLASIDLPCIKENEEIVCFSSAYRFQPHETSTVPDFESVGWLVPDHFRYRWSLELGDSLELLPQLLKNMETIDLFVHDSFHAYLHMKSEFEMVWPHLKSGGLLLADDIFAFGHAAFSDFAKVVGRNFFSYSGMGIIVK